MKQLPPKTASKSEMRAFVVRLAVLLALIGLVYWAGGLSPWSRADARVTVEVVK